MKNFLIFILLFLNGLNCLATEKLDIPEKFEIQLGQDYLMTTDQKIQTVAIANPDIITISPFFTIFNEKNILLLHPSKVGETNFTIFLDNSDAAFHVSVKPTQKNSEFKTIQKGVFEIMLLDSPPDFEGK